MGGNSKGETAPAASNAVAATMPAYLKNAVPTMQPAFLPGQQAQLAQDLTAGFAGGVGPSEWMKALAQIYQPAQTMNFNGPAAAAPRPAAKPAPKAAAKASPLNMKAPARTVSLGRNAR